MDLIDFETALSIYESGSWAEASYRTYQSTSSVSKHVRKLEDELGARLFNRGADEGKLLTPAGCVALPLIEEICSVYTQILSSAEKLRYKDAHQLRIGYLPIIGNNGVSSILSEMRADYPDIKIDHVLRQQNELIHMLRTSKLDAAFVFFVDSAQDPTKKLVGLIDEEFSVIRVKRSRGMHIGMSADHPLAHRKSIDIHELDGETFVLNRVPYHLKNLRGFAQNVFGVADRSELPCKTRIMDFLDRDAVLSFIQSGNGVLPISCDVPTIIPEGMTFVSVAGSQVTNSVFLAYRNGSPSLALRTLIEYAEAFATEDGDGR